MTPATSAPTAHASPTEPPHADREKVTHLAGIGCFIQAVGVLSMIAGAYLFGTFGAIAGTVVMIVLFAVGSGKAITWRCGNCKNPLASKEVGVCPACHAHIKPPAKTSLGTGGALLVGVVCIALIYGLAKPGKSADGNKGGVKIDPSYLRPRLVQEPPAPPATSRPDMQEVGQKSDADDDERHTPATDTERTELLKWFRHTSVCMRRAADLEIRSFKLDKKDLTDERNVLEMTDYTRTMCGGGLRAFLTRKAGYSIPDADALLDDLAERMVKARLGTD